MSFRRSKARKGRLVPDNTERGSQAVGWQAVGRLMWRAGLEGWDFSKASTTNLIIFNLLMLYEFPFTRAN